MTLQQFVQIGQYLHLSDDDRSRPGDDDYNYLYKAQPTLDIINTSGYLYKLGWDLGVDEVMTGFKGRFIPKQYMPDKPTKWGMKPCGMADNKAGHLKYKIYLG
jgi:hypothetical protein